MSYAPARPLHIHILGICGTFMGGLAQLAAARGDRVTGADANVYPPMSDQLAAAGIELTEGWDPEQLSPSPDLVVIGNALSRGNPAVEAVLERDLPFTSGPAWLAEHVLRGRHVLAIAGTHGKTTTASMLAHILSAAGQEPGFLIGGVPQAFGMSARLGAGRPFVVEADEYDTAFFDKRSKFVHYRPRTLVLNNLEFDHADIFDDLASIQRQFHHLIRTIPGSGTILTNAEEPALDDVLAMGCWTPVETFAPPDSERSADWQAEASADGSRFRVVAADGREARVAWSLLGTHNVTNALAAIAAAATAGVAPETSADALSTFAGVRRRLEVCGRVRGITVYDDFAHHPTAIATTLAGLRARVGEARILAAVDLSSNTMRMGVHAGTLSSALAEADHVLLHADDRVEWEPATVAAALPPGRATICRDPGKLADTIASIAGTGDHIVLMSNGGFGGLPARLPGHLEQAARDRGQS